jgi:dipeptidase
MYLRKMFLIFAIKLLFNMRKNIILPFILLLLGFTYSSACTNLIVGKAASADGSTIISYSADDYGMFGELYHFRAGFHPLGSLRAIWDRDTHVYHGQIKEAQQTYNVIGNINEFQVSIGETTWGGREELADSLGILDYGSLMNIALQRSRTAREAIKVMTTLVAEYGYCSEGESFTIADPNEVWIMDMIAKGPGMKGAVWVAVRIPDDCIAAHANQCRIHQFNMKDKKNCMYSADVISFARSKGYFSGKDKDFSFANAYNPLDFGGRRYCEARVWSFFNLFTDRGSEFLPYIKGETDVPMPLYVKPNRKLSVQDVKEAMRDHYENTPLDITKDLGAGPFHMPYRLTPLSFKVDGKEYFNERPISTFQTAFVFVAQMRAHMPNAVGGVLWYGTDDANCTVFTPVYCCADSIPPCYSHIADGAKFSWDSSFWVFNWVSNMVYPRYDMMIGDLKGLQHEIEGRFNHNQDSIELAASSLLKTNPTAAKKMLTDYTIACAQSTHDAWRQLGEFLLVKYNDGTVRPEKNGKFIRDKWGMPLRVKRPGYPEDFLREYVKQTGDRYLIPKK